ncbi:hypothetical protein [Wolbachia endosymbiont of Bemisia tabaci]|uniref:hypothetical protein n=1 Tax=Wolbachia endosymbiont of Bemisia tabaci TaxID=215173 RepID=UPI000D5601F1|nr:hypothetical protein [Wolbachia endosymbiont of Bemisia tabaci]
MIEQNNEINDDFYAESVEKTKSILDEAIAKGHTISDDDRQTLEMVKANEEFAEKVLSGEDYKDLQDFAIL